MIEKDQKTDPTPSKPEPASTGDQTKPTEAKSPAADSLSAGGESVSIENKSDSKAEDKAKEKAASDGAAASSSAETRVGPETAKVGADHDKDKDESKATASPAPDKPAEPSAPVKPGDSDKPALAANTPPAAGETKPGAKSGTAILTAPDGEKKPPKKLLVDPGEAHVLVVEDNVPNFVLIARMLAYMGIQRCEWKTSGWQVVEFADTLPRIDLILMDIRLPYEDGYQALEKVRANPRLKDTLVVAVTAEASVEQIKRAKEAGFDGFLGKPLDPDRFPDQIRRVLSGEPVWEIH